MLTVIFFEEQGRSQFVSAPLHFCTTAICSRVSMHYLDNQKKSYRSTREKIQLRLNIHIVKVSCDNVTLNSQETWQLFFPTVWLGRGLFSKSNSNYLPGRNTVTLKATGYSAGLGERDGRLKKEGGQTWGPNPWQNTSLRTVLCCLL